MKTLIQNLQDLSNDIGEVRADNFLHGMMIAKLNYEQMNEEIIKFLKKR
jgi:hypothetical protein